MEAIPIRFNVPDFFKKVSEKIKKEETGEEREKRKDQSLINLIETEGWKVFSETIERRIEILKSMVDPESGKSIIGIDEDVNTIGVKYLIISFAIYQLRSALDLPKMVLDSKIFDEQQRGTKK